MTRLFNLLNGWVANAFSMSPGANVTKLFMAVSYDFSYIDRAFIPGEPFQPSLMFHGKARSLPKRGAPERCFTWVGS